MQTFLALYRGPSIGAAKMIAVSTDLELVPIVAAHMLNEERPSPDSVLAALAEGKQEALREIMRQAFKECDTVDSFVEYLLSHRTSENTTAWELAEMLGIKEVLEERLQPTEIKLVGVTHDSEDQ